jgi:GNAT superfamily N-acetyltransferase
VEGRDQDSAAFSVVHLASGELAGEALVWGIDRHNRSAHLGISLRPGFRRRGLGTDTVRLLCGYGFAILGLQRLQAETLADNAAMIAAATRAGFVPEGTLRRAAWSTGASPTRSSSACWPATGIRPRLRSQAVEVRRSPAGRSLTHPADQPRPAPARTGGGRRGPGGW